MLDGLSHVRHIDLFIGRPSCSDFTTARQPIAAEVGKLRLHRTVIECRRCVSGECNHGAQCPMMIRWDDDLWDGTFWRRCECDARVEPPQGYAPVTVRRIADHPGHTLP